MNMTPSITLINFYSHRHLSLVANNDSHYFLALLKAIWTSYVSLNCSAAINFLTIELFCKKLSTMPTRKKMVDWTAICSNNKNVNYSTNLSSTQVRICVLIYNMGRSTLPLSKCALQFLFCSSLLTSYVFCSQTVLCWICLVLTLVLCSGLMYIFPVECWISNVEQTLRSDYSAHFGHFEAKLFSSAPSL